MKRAIFINRFTTTHTISQPVFVLGKAVTKSIVISSHFHYGTDNGCNSPLGRWCDDPALQARAARHVPRLSGVPRYTFT